MEEKKLAVKENKDLLLAYLAKRTEISENDFYDIGGGKREPLAKALRLLANREEIRTQFVKDNKGNPCVGADSEKAWARVRGWIEKFNPQRSKFEIVQEVESSITIIFETEFLNLIMDAIDNGIWIKTLQQKIFPRYDIQEGKPVLVEREHQLHIIRQWLRIKKFGDRIATTKAENICIRKLLGIEWREEVEIETEKVEIEAIRKSQISISKKEEPLKGEAKMPKSVPTIVAKPSETVTVSTAISPEANIAIVETLVGTGVQTVKEPEVQSSSAEQRQRIHILYRKAGISDENYYQMLWYDFGKKSSTELTFEEAKKLIESLERQIPKKTLDFPKENVVK